MSKVDDIIRITTTMSFNDRLSEGRNASDNLFDAFKRLTGSGNQASNMLYGMVQFFLEKAGRSLTRPDYEFAHLAFVSSVDFSTFNRIIRENYSYSQKDLFLRCVNSFTRDECKELALFGILLYGADGYIDSSERSFISSLY